jgi:electron transfer flavoprotein alpha subunit
MSDVIIVGEISKGELASHTYELATLARALGSDVTCVLSLSSARTDFDKNQAATSLGEYGVSQLHCVDCGTGLSGFALAKYVAALCESSENTVVLAPQTYLGRDVAAHVSVFIDRGVLSNAVDVSLVDNSVTTKHMVFGGTKIVTAQMSKAPYVVLVRPKSVAVEKGGGVSCETKDAQSTDLPETAQTKIVSSEVVESEGPELEEASIVISGGRGLSSKENYEKLVGGCATALGAATGASRAIVDAGWVPYSSQVGQTGKTVKPDVYIACGISGATQHLVGMKGSKNIIAINTDDQAPIFSVADLGIVGDVNVVLPQLIEKINAKK